RSGLVERTHPGCCLNFKHTLVGELLYRDGHSGLSLADAIGRECCIHRERIVPRSCAGIRLDIATAPTGHAATAATGEASDKSKNEQEAGQAPPTAALGRETQQEKHSNHDSYAGREPIRHNR